MKVLVAKWYAIYLKLYRARENGNHNTYTRRQKFCIIFWLVCLWDLDQDLMEANPDILKVLEHWSCARALSCISTHLLYHIKLPYGGTCSSRMLGIYQSGFILKFISTSFVRSSQLMSSHSIMEPPPKLTFCTRLHSVYRPPILLYVRPGPSCFHNCIFV